jgi:large conductance mechanosensitive channel
VKGFKAFLLKTNAMALAVGVIIGVALGNVITSLVKDVIMPPIGMLFGNLDFSEMKWVLKAATGEDSATEVAIRYGAFVNVVIAFVVVALIVYVVTSLLLREPDPAPTKTCKYCLETVPADATKCRACTSSI